MTFSICNASLAVNKSGRGACPRSSNPSKGGGKPLFLTCSFHSSRLMGKSLLLDFLQRTDAALTNGWVALPFTNSGRIVPAALTFLAVSNRYRDRNALAVLHAAKLHLRHDEQIPQITLMLPEQFERASRSPQCDLCF